MDNSEKINAARKKIMGESFKIERRLALYIGEKIDEQITNEKNAEKILSKSLSDCISTVIAAAQKKANNGYACLSGEEVKRIAYEFYEIDADESMDNLTYIFELI